MTEQKLAEVWQVERDGETVFELRMPVDNDKMPRQPLAQVVYADIVCKATEQALANAQALLREAVTTT